MHHFHSSHQRSSRPHGRRLRMEQCEDRALLSGWGEEVTSVAPAPSDLNLILSDTAYVRLFSETDIADSSNFYLFTSGTALQTVPSGYYSDSSTALTDGLFLGGTSGDALFNNGRLISAGSAAEEVVAIPELPPPGIPTSTTKITPIPTEISHPTSLSTPGMIDLAAVLESPAQPTLIAQHKASPALAMVPVKPAFLQSPGPATSPVAVESLDRAFAIEEAPASLEPLSAVQVPASPVSANLITNPVSAIATPQTPPLRAELEVQSEPLTEKIVPRQVTKAEPTTDSPTALLTRIRQAGLALTVGSLALVIRLRWDRRQASEPPREFPGRNR